MDAAIAVAKAADSSGKHSSTYKAAVAAFEAAAKAASKQDGRRGAPPEDSAAAASARAARQAAAAAGVAPGIDLERQVLFVQTQEYQDASGALAGAVKTANNAFWLLFQQV